MCVQTCMYLMNKLDPICGCFWFIISYFFYFKQEKLLREEKKLLEGKVKVLRTKCISCSSKESNNCQLSLTDCSRGEEW